MSADTLKVLLVEDNPGDARLVREMLQREGVNDFEVVHVTRLSEALKLLSERPFDAVLLDLSLPDSEGLTTLDKARSNNEARTPPILVVTGQEEGAGAEMNSAQHGAEDYLEKSGLEAPALVRSIRFAVERQRLRARLESEEVVTRREAELASLESLDVTPTTSATARAYGLARLAESNADAFEMMVNQYMEHIAKAVEDRKYKITRSPSQELRIMSQRLGFLRAGPRDVVAMHIEALRRSKSGKVTLSYAISEEARLMLIELMGNLVSYYRDHVVPMRGPRGRDAETQNEESIK